MQLWKNTFAVGSCMFFSDVGVYSVKPNISRRSCPGGFCPFG